MKTYGRDALLGFLTEIDRLLEKPADMEIIGGAAALLVYGATSPTKDIDSFLPIPDEILRAAAEVRRRIPLDRATVADPPWNYEDRRLLVDLPFHSLSIWVPERHDLLLMKSIRSSRHDDEVIQEMHQVQPFDLETIVHRWNEEISQAIGDHRILDQKIQLIIGKLFGDPAMSRIKLKQK